MRQYLDLLHQIYVEGQRQSNRTGIDTFTLPGAMLKFDLREGFPAITTKRLAFKAVVGELIGFLRGCTNVQDFQNLGCNVWDGNAYSPYWLANPAHSGEEGDLGRIYGAQWRDWSGIGEVAVGFSGSTTNTRISIDQLQVALDTVRNDPHSRRIIVNAWNAAEINQAALPPCHTGFQLLPHVSTKVLHMTFQMRSWDMFLGAPFNIASYALLLELFAAWTGYTAGTLTAFGSDCHIYANHLDQVKEQLKRDPHPLPKLKLDLPHECETLRIDDLVWHLQPNDIKLVDYTSHEAIKAPMAV